MSQHANATQIDTIVTTATRELFAMHGIELGDGEPTGVIVRPSDHDIAVSIGFTAPQLQGAMLVTTRKTIIALAWPHELRNREPSEREVCDWAGELVNQLLGRVKNTLVAFGLALEQSTPTVVTGTHVHRSPASTNVARRYLFVHPSGSVLVYFDAAMADGLVLPPPGDGAARSATEGELRLF